MKKMFTTIAALGVVLGSTAALAGGADEMPANNQPALSGLYVGAGVGYGSLSGKAISAVRAAARASGVKNTDSGVVANAHIGYDINRYLAAQVSYLYLPKVGFKFQGKSNNVYNNMYALEAKAKYPLMDGKVIPFATAGYGIVVMTPSGDHVKSTHAWEPILGAGVEYKVTPHVGVNAQYKVVINANNDFNTVNMGLAGVNYYF